MNNFEFFEFWTWRNTCETNEQLRRQNTMLVQQLQEQTRLLEQIRRNSLTPAERAAEDAAQLAAKHAAAKKIAEQKARDIKSVKIFATVLLTGILFLSVIATCAPKTKEWEVQPTATATPAHADWAPRAEIVR
jgi:phage-related minor tail protein